MQCYHVTCIALPHESPCAATYVCRPFFGFSEVPVPAQASVPPLQAAAMTVSGSVQFLTDFQNEVSCCHVHALLAQRRRRCRPPHLILQAESVRGLLQPKSNDRRGHDMSPLRTAEHRFQ